MKLQNESPMTVTAELAVTSQWGTLQDIQGVYFQQTEMFNPQRPARGWGLSSLI